MRRPGMTEKSAGLQLITIRNIVVSAGVDGDQMLANAMTERTAFRIAQYAFLSAGILIILYWGLVLLGKVQAPVASSVTLAGAVSLMGCLRTGAQWLEGNRRHAYPLTILVWMTCALGGVSLMIFG